MVLSAVLLIGFVCLVLGECEGTREKNSKRVKKKPVLRLVALV